MAKRQYTAACTGCDYASFPMSRALAKSAADMHSDLGGVHRGVARIAKRHIGAAAPRRGQAAPKRAIRVVEPLWLLFKRAAGKDGVTAWLTQLGERELIA